MPEVSTEIAAARPLRLHGTNILIVDADAAFAQSVRELLAGEGAAVEVAANMTDAWMILSTFKHRFNGVVLDLNLPDSEGMEFLERVRRSPKHQALPVVVCTSTTHRDIVARAIGHGVRHYLVKPCAEASVRLKLVEALAA